MPVNHVKLVVRGANAEEAHATLEKVDGEIRKRKPADLHEPKWRSAVPAE